VRAARTSTTFALVPSVQRLANLQGRPVLAHLHHRRGASSSRRTRVDTWTLHQDLGLVDDPDPMVIPHEFVRPASGRPDCDGRGSGIDVWSDPQRAASRPLRRVSESCLAGDSAQTCVPNGGSEMNYRSGDAFNLGLELAGCCTGWGRTRDPAGQYEADAADRRRNPHRIGENVLVPFAVTRDMGRTGNSIGQDSDDGRAHRAAVRGVPHHNDAEKT